MSQAARVDVSELPPGYVWQGRYVIVKGLEKGSGGSVYLVNDLSESLTKETVQHKSPLNEFIPID